MTLLLEKRTQSAIAAKLAGENEKESGHKAVLTVRIADVKLTRQDSPQL